MIWDANVKGDSKLFECSALPASVISCEQGLWVCICFKPREIDWQRFSRHGVGNEA